MMAFSFFRRKSVKSSAVQSSKPATSSDAAAHSAAGVALRWVTIETNRQPSVCASASETSGICVSDGNTDAMSGDGRLLRLDSSVDMKLGDLGVSETPVSVQSRSSQLSKNLDAVLHDKDALAYFISYLQPLSADNLVRFWLDVEAFRLAAERTTIHLAFPTNEEVRLTETQTPAKPTKQTPPSTRYKPVEKTEVLKDRVQVAQTARMGQQRTELSEDVAQVAQTVGIISQRVLTSNCDHVLAKQTNQALPSMECSLEVLTGGVLVSRMPEVPQQQRVPTNYCGHASSPLTSSSAKFTGQLPAHGEVVVSTDSAIPSLGSAVLDSGLGRSPVDCCLASNPSITQSTGAGQQITEQFSRGVQPPNPSTTQHGTVPHGVEHLPGAGQHTVAQSLQHGAGWKIGEQLSGTEQQTADSLSDDRDITEATSSAASSENISELPHKVIERDALAIFTKYLSLDCPCPVAISDDLRVVTVKRMCSHDDDGSINTQCFNECQQAVYKILENEYFTGFKQSAYHSKHQIDVLTGSEIYLSDILYDDTAFSYFTEFMEAESAVAVLQCFLDLDNFHQLILSSSSSSSPLSSQQPVTFDCSTAQDDAVVIYDKYFSLQATGSLRFDDSVRLEVETNICAEHGVTRECFSTPRHIIYCHMERTYLQSFLHSNWYIKFLSDLINTVQLAHDSVVFPRPHAAASSDSSSGHNVIASAHNAESTGTRNTLLAMDTRGQHIKRAVNKIGDDLRIDASLFDPDNLWHRPTAGEMRFGRVDTLGQFISEFDPEPDSSKKRIGSLFGRKSEKTRLDEELALQVAQMIINDVTTTTQSLDRSSRGHDPESSGHDPEPSASFQL